MSNINFNDLLNPVGSVTHQAQDNKGLKDREFTVSADNPVISMIETMLSSGKYHKDDVGDLYDKAYQWEIDRANWIDQLEVEQAIKMEQREYDDYTSQVQRARKAGINLDVGANAGSGSGVGSGSGGSSSGAKSPDNTGSVQKTDNYANRNFVLDCINTTGQFINNLSSSVGNIISSVSNMRLAGSQVKLNDAQANLVDAQANEVNQLLAGKVKTQELNNTTAYLEQLASLKPLINPDATDDEYIQTLTGLGIGKEQLPSAMNILKQFHKDPNLHAQYYKGKADSLAAQVYNATYTKEVVTQMTEMHKNLEYQGLHLQLMRTGLEDKVATLLNTDKFAADTANLEQQLVGAGTEQAKYTQGATKQASAELKYNTEVFLTAISKKAGTLEKIRKDKQDIVDAAMKRTGEHKGMSAEEKAKWERLTAEEVALETMLSNEFYKIKSTYLSAAYQNYTRSYQLDENGELNSAASLEVGNMFSEITFNDLIHHTKTPGEIASEWVDKVVTVTDSAAKIYIGAKAGKALDTRGASNAYKRGYRQGFRTVRDRDFTNVE